MVLLRLNTESLVIENGNLTYLTKEDDKKLLRGLPVYNTSTGSVEAF